MSHKGSGSHGVGKGKKYSFDGSLAPVSADIFSYEFKPGFKHEIEVLSLADLSGPNKDKLVSAHRTNFYIVIWFHEGPHAHTLDFKQVSVPANGFLFVNKGQVHSFESIDVKGQLIMFTDAFFCKDVDCGKFLSESSLFNDFIEPAVIAVNERSVELVELFSTLAREYRVDEDEYHFDLLHNHLFSFLMHSERLRRLSGLHASKKGPDADHLTRFKGLVGKFFRDRKPVSAYARDMNVSEKRLTQAVFRTVGKTPKQLIDDRLVLEAKRLMIHTNQTVKEVGYTLGFDEPTNFIKYFRKHVGCTPTEFKEKNRVDRL